MHRINLAACDNQRNLSERSYENMHWTPLDFLKMEEFKDVIFISFNLKSLIGI